MASVYILHSRKLDRFYTGSCKDFQLRWDQHLRKLHPEGFTSKAEDWELFLLIDDLAYDQARRMERHIKRMKSSVYIRNLRRYPEMIVRLKESAD